MVIGIGAMLLMAFALVLFFSLSQRKLKNEQIKIQSQELQHQQALLEGNLRVQEEERQRISAQLHDDVCSTLGVLNLSYHRLLRTDSKSPEYAELCAEINALITRTSEVARSISHDLLPPTLEGFGLVEAIRELRDQVNRTGAVDMDFDLGIGRREFIYLEVELHLFRILQELTNNTLKHAKATQISVLLSRVGDEMLLKYTDNGVGFDMETHTTGALGLKNIYNRAKIVDGTVTVKSKRDEGFEFQLLMPFPMTRS